MGYGPCTEPVQLVTHFYGDCAAAASALIMNINAIIRQLIGRMRSPLCLWCVSKRERGIGFGSSGLAMRDCDVVLILKQEDAGAGEIALTPGISSESPAPAGPPFLTRERRTPSRFRSRSDTYAGSSGRTARPRRRSRSLPLPSSTPGPSVSAPQERPGVAPGVPANSIAKASNTPPSGVPRPVPLPLRVPQGRARRFSTELFERCRCERQRYGI